MRLLLAPWLAFLCVWSTASKADTPTEARRAIASAYRQMDQAAAHKDVNGALLFNAPGFVSKLPDGRVSHVSQRQTTAFLFQRAQSVHGNTLIQNITVDGDRAAVTIKKHQELVVVVPDPDTGKHDDYVFNMVLYDEWQKHGMRWLRASSKMISRRVSKNGAR